MSNKISNVTPINLNNISKNYFTEKTYAILVKWLSYADKQFEEWPERPDCGYFFGGSYWYGLETADTAIVYAAIAKIGNYDEKLTKIPKQDIINKAIKAIRYLGFTHDTGPADCVRVKSLNPHCSGTKWGGAKDKFFQASQHGVPISNFGLAAWLLWDELDDETKLLVQNVLWSYADRWSNQEPRNGTYYDTQAEENGWTAVGIGISAAMFPEHDKVELWKEKTLQWLLCSCTTYLDRHNRNLYKEKPLAGGWVNSITIHPDFTTENHGFVHPNYLSAGLLFGGDISLFNLLAGQEKVPNPFLHWDDIYDRALKIWSMYDGLMTPIQGQDWWYNQQSASAHLHAYLNIFRKNQDAATLEKLSLESIASIQESNKNGCIYEAKGEECIITEFQTAKDMEHKAASYIAKIYILHCLEGQGETPLDKEELNDRLKGVYNYPYGNSIIYRTKNSFSCFTWRNCVMATTLPKKGMWTSTAMVGSYIGSVLLSTDLDTNTESIPEFPNEEVVKNVIDEKIIPKTDGFSATARIERGNKQLFQDVAFVALPDGKTVYLEKFTANKDCEILQLKTANIGIRNEDYSDMPEVAKGFRTVHLNDGTSKTFKGYYGKDPDRIVEWDKVSYLNVDHEIGYIMLNNGLVEYINKHQYPKWKGVEDILTLNKLENAPIKMTKGEYLKPLIVITTPNTTFSQTANIANNINILKDSCDINNDLSLLIVEDDLIYFNYKYTDTLACGSLILNSKNEEINLFKGHNKISDNSYTWEADINKREAGYQKALFKIKDISFSPNCDESNFLIVDIVSNIHALFYNPSEGAVSFKLKEVSSGETCAINIEPGKVYDKRV